MTVEEALVTIEAILGDRSLNDLQETIFRCAWEQKGYSEIAEVYGYDAEYIKYVGFQLWKKLSDAFGEKITKSNFRTALRRRAQLLQILAAPIDTTDINSSELKLGYNTQLPSQNQKSKIKKRTDWGEAIDVSIFYGRSNELATLKQWIIQERCRLVAVLGIGGTGKTALSVKLAEQIQDEFEFIIWRSLHNAPAIDSLLNNLIQFLSNRQETNLVEDISSKILRLLDYFQKYRCLVVIDNVETILCSAETSKALSGCKAGNYREGYEEYGELFKRIGELRHNSCLVLTSREKPKEVATLEGKTFPVRSLPLAGLTTSDGQEIFKAKGNFVGSVSDWQTLIQSYAGNPLALRIVATTINDLFAGDITKFLAQGAVIFGDIQDLLTQQFSRLSGLETEIMSWLAINREPVAIAELQADILSPLMPAQLMEVLESLERRSLLEKSAALFTLQPVLMEYVTNRLISQVCQEIENQRISIYKSHALIKAQVKNYIQDIQVKLILKPLINQLLRVFGNSEALDCQLMQILSPLRGKLPIETGYAAGNTINLLRQLQLNFSDRDFSNLTVWQADLQGVNLHRVNFSGSDLARSTFTENLGYIFSMAVSPNGKLLATTDSYGKIHLWRIADGQQILSWNAHIGWVRSLAFSPDGKTVISGSEDATVKLWDVSTGQCRQLLRGHTGWILFVAFSSYSNTTLLASCSEDTTVKLWDFSTGKCYQTLRGHTSYVCYVAFSPDGKTLASSSFDRTVKLWDITTGQCLKTLQGHQEVVGFVTFISDGQSLISASEDEKIKVWNVQTGQCERTLPGGQNDWIWWSAVALSCDNKTLAIGSRDQTLKLWDISTGQLLRTLQYSSGIRTIVFSPDGKTLIGSHEDQTLKLWDVADGRCLRTFQGYSAGVWSIAFSPDGKTLVSGGADQLVKVWNVADGQCLRIIKGHTDMVRFVTYSPDGQTLASTSADKTMKLWDVSSGKCLRTFRGHKNWVMSVRYSPDGQTLASGSLDQTVRLWDINTGQCLKVLQAHNTLGLSVAYNPDGQTLASGGADYTVKLWDIKTGQLLRVFQGHTSWVWFVAFSPDGQTLASSSIDRTVRIWNIRNGECLNVLHGHASWVNSVAYSLDGQTLASGGLDGTVRLWDVRQGRCLRVLQGHTRWVLSVTFTTGVGFSRDSGQVLVSSSDDQTIRFWDIETGECLRILRSERPYEGMKIAGVTSITEAQKATLKVLGAVED